jgi:hypothetical protein
MSISVEFPQPKEVVPSKGTAGLKSRLGGCATTVSTLMEAGKNIGNASLVKKDIG